MLRELIGNFTAHGVRRIALINTGVSTEKPLDEIAAGDGGVLVLHMRLMGQAAEPLIEHKDGGHADERETSVVLALDPRSVRMDKLSSTARSRRPAPPAIRPAPPPSRASGCWRHGSTTWSRRSPALARPQRITFLPIHGEVARHTLTEGS